MQERQGVGSWLQEVLPNSRQFKWISLIDMERFSADPFKIEENYINYEIFSSIPSKFAPYSAAKIIYDSLKKYCDFTKDIV